MSQRRKTILIVIILLIAVSGGSIFFITKLFRKSSRLPKKEIEAIISSADLEKKYTEEIAKIMKSYFEEKKSINLADLQNEALKKEKDRWLNLVLKTKNDLLALRVPAKYKDMHLDLVLGLIFQAEGLKGDEKKIKEGEEKIEKAIENYPWLQPQPPSTNASTP